MVLFMLLYSYGTLLIVLSVLLNFYIHKYSIQIDSTFINFLLTDKLTLDYNIIRNLSKRTFKCFMRIPIEFYNHLKSLIRISDVIKKYVALVSKHTEYIGLCPFHHEKTPSFTVNDNKKFYHCFGCNAHGDVIKFISEIDSIGNYTAAAIKIANNYNITIPSSGMSITQDDLCEEDNQIYNIKEKKLAVC